MSTLKCSFVGRGSVLPVCYLRQGGDVFARVCLFVCLSVSNITQKVVDGFG